MTKVAAQKTAGVLGDDLALNAEQVSGVRAERELPVVWAVAKGSARNKVILIPSALLLSAFLPALITPLLMLGGAYLCFEGFEKISHRMLQPHMAAQETQAVLDALHDPNLDLAEFEAEKIKGAIRTDFILSAEIIVIALGTVQGADIVNQASVVIVIGVLMTIGVYGFVAGIVKLDDLGDYLLATQSVVKQKLGAGILVFAPFLMKSLTFVGTIAMFLVGGSIIAHGIPGFGHTLQQWAQTMQLVPGGIILADLLLTGLSGVLIGALITPFFAAAEEIIHRD